MKAASAIAVLVPLCIIAGCHHKVQATPPPAAQARIYPPSTVADNAPPPQLPPPDAANVKKGDPEVAKQQPPPKPKKQTKRSKPKPADNSQTAKDAAAASPTSQQAAAGEPPEMSPIGQLSSTGDRSGVPSRQDIKQLIDTTGSSLKNIEASLKSDEQRLTATQIHTFLTKAQQALDQDDLDGANTLATKAKVLLNELTKG